MADKSDKIALALLRRFAIAFGDLPFELKLFGAFRPLPRGGCVADQRQWRTAVDGVYCRGSAF